MRGGEYYDVIGKLIQQGWGSPNTYNSPMTKEEIAE